MRKISRVAITNKHRACKTVLLFGVGLSPYYWYSFMHLHFHTTSWEASHHLINWPCHLWPSVESSHLLHRWNTTSTMGKKTHTPTQLLHSCIALQQPHKVLGGQVNRLEAWFIHNRNCHMWHVHHKVHNILTCKAIKVEKAVRLTDTWDRRCPGKHN